MKVYVFTEKDSDRIITEIRAGSHAEALTITSLPFETDFYSFETE